MQDVNQVAGAGGNNWISEISTSIELCCFNIVLFCHFRLSERLEVQKMLIRWSKWDQLDQRDLLHLGGAKDVNQVGSIWEALADQ